MKQEVGTREYYTRDKYNIIHVLHNNSDEK